MDVEPVLVGREQERAALRSILEHAVSGDPALVLVHGEAGIGKTSLVRELASVAKAEGSHVLLGSCLRFGANVTSYLPFTQALTQWLRTTSRDVRGKLAPLGTLEELVPALNDGSEGVALLQIGALVDALLKDGPTVLVLDDLQWADPSSLDVLSYLVAGFAKGQRLAILTTYRDTDLGAGHRLHGWLADTHRMPSVTGLELGRMDTWAVEQMIMARDGAMNDAGQAQEVLRRSDGNPYLARLLIDEALAGREVARGVRLVDALSASWHRLPAPARRVTQLIAVAGAPVAFPVLRELSARFGVNAHGTAQAVLEASAEGITIETETGAIWFRHPLLAETIAGTLNSWDREESHRMLAGAWLAAVAVDERDRANFLALHYVAASDPDQGFGWCLRAADEAEGCRGWQEAASHLSMAVSLLPKVSEAVVAQVDPVGLLVRAGGACEAAGDDRGAVRHYEAALAGVDRHKDPLLASRILLELHVLRDQAGLGSTHLSLTEPREVIALRKECRARRSGHWGSHT